MTRRLFRDILLVYALYWLIAVAYSIYVGTTLGPEAGKAAAELINNKELMQELVAHTEQSSQIQSIRWSITIITSCLIVITWIGLFKFWKPARILFLINLGLIYLLSPIVDYYFTIQLMESPLAEFYNSLYLMSQNPIVKILGTVGTAISTCIAMIIYTCSGKTLFDESSQQNYT